MRLPPVLRGLLRTPGEIALAVLALGAGIALTTSLFSIVRGILWTALPIPDIARVVRIDTASDSLAGFREQDGRKLFESIDGITVTGANARIGRVAHRLQAAYVSPTFFATLRTDAARGTAILQTHPYRTAVISHSLWSSVLNQDRNVLGRAILINNEPVTVVGVMPSRWGYPRAEDIWGRLGSFFRQRDRCARPWFFQLPHRASPAARRPERSPLGRQRHRRSAPSCAAW
jgi:hypothetical protein